MTLYNFMLIAHIAVFGVWFGTDLATFFLSRRVLDTGYAVDTRQVLATSMLSVEVVARLALPTMLALGLCLSIEGGLLNVDRFWQVPVVVFGAAWVALVWSIHRSHDSVLGPRLVSVDLVVRSVICVVLWVAGLRSAFTLDGPFLRQSLGTKVTLFALIMTCGIAIRFMLRPFAPAFASLVAEGSSPEREAAMAGSIRMAQPLVVVIWASLLSATALAVTQTVPWAV